MHLCIFEEYAILNIMMLLPTDVYVSPEYKAMPIVGASYIDFFLGQYIYYSMVHIVVYKLCSKSEVSQFFWENLFLQIEAMFFESGYVTIRWIKYDFGLDEKIHAAHQFPHDSQFLSGC